MNFIRTAVSEFLGLFIDDGSLALFVIILVAVITGAIKLLSLPPLAGGIALVLGCVLLLLESLVRAVRKKS
ncbi:MAG: hypothetical protein JWN11_685 [Hyphomicrobiales bacterium]|nr:hypothetical protein [Hyphomicrobiales bacterium]